MSPARILLLTTVMETGGAQKAFMQLGRGLADRGYEVRVAAMYDKTGVIPDYEKAYGLPITDLAMKPRGSFLRKAGAMMRGVLRLRRLMRMDRIDIVQSFTHYSNLLGPFVGWTAGVPVRVTSQRIVLNDRSSLFRVADRWISRLQMAQRMVAVAESVRRYCIEREGLRSDRVITVPNGLDLEEWPVGQEAEQLRRRVRDALGLAPEEIAIATVARLVPQKGHLDLLDAIPKVVRARPAARFLWIGDGDLRSDLEQAVRDANLGEHVRFLGARSDVLELLQACDLFVLPSLWEGMPNSVLEAMAASLPVVATCVDGTPEAVVDGETGWLVPPSDPDALADGILDALENPVESRKMGEQGRRRVERDFSLERYVDGFVRVYDDLVRRRQDGSAPS